MDDIVSFTDEIDLEEYEKKNRKQTASRSARTCFEMGRWVIRRRARASVIYEGLYSETGYFGNEATFGHIYTLAALEVSKR